MSEVMVDEMGFELAERARSQSLEVVHRPANPQAIPGIEFLRDPHFINSVVLCAPENPTFEPNQLNQKLAEVTAPHELEPWQRWEAEFVGSRHLLMPTARFQYDLGRCVVRSEATLVNQQGDHPIFDKTKEVQLKATTHVIMVPCLRLLNQVDTGTQYVQSSDLPRGSAERKAFIQARNANTTRLGRFIGFF